MASAFQVAYIFPAELCDTPIRASALGVCNVFARTGTVLVPVLATAPALVLTDTQFECEAPSAHASSAVGTVHFTFDTMPTAQVVQDCPRSEPCVLGEEPERLYAFPSGHNITLYGKAGHGASPHMTIDPIVQAAKLVLDLQTIVSREINPIDACVITVGSIHGGQKHNII